MLKETIYPMIVWFGIMILVLIILMLSENRQYQNASMSAGHVCIELKAPLKGKVKKFLFDMCIVFSILFLFPQIRNMHKQSNMFNLFSLIWFVGALFIAFIIALLWKNRTQKICDNGILDRFDFIPWSNVKKIKPIESIENCEEIIVLLHENVRNNNHIVLSCMPQQVESIRSFIEMKIDYKK